MTPQELQNRLEKLGPGTEVRITDLTGTQDHYEAVIVSPLFQGKLTMEQHRMVYALVNPEMTTGELHAFSIKTYTPEQFRKVAER